METAGWRNLLKLCPQLKYHLAGTSIFVAPHHGRADGRYAELFNFLKPEIVIFSDGARRFKSQETDDWYRQRCHGAIVIANPTQRRYVLTTRNDGDMHIEVFEDGSWTLLPTSVQDWEILLQHQSAS